MVLPYPIQAKRLLHNGTLPRLLPYNLPPHPPCSSVDLFLPFLFFFLNGLPNLSLPESILQVSDPLQLYFFGNWPWDCPQKGLNSQLFSDIFFVSCTDSQLPNFTGNLPVALPLSLVSSKLAPRRGLGSTSPKYLLNSCLASSQLPPSERPLRMRLSTPPITLRHH